MGKTVRAIDRFIFVHPEHSGLVVVSAGQPFDSDHPVVKAQGWAFKPDDEDEKPRRSRRKVEQATAAPGEKRATK